ncbi:Na+-transporting malonate decarboxylase, carboxybiotin decarboxylase subunit [uncultured delta proteobacterium]|uniref:Na+-transporting malonate decarboxylase, carboxybiotin decarboxylase subunit n=1 Tax=uncultured delta proteobacterium TaxID=34034 RepID=A0A212KDF5_9DELT|nr:Na+-transporting malonate decarboxylase, carboxybiotin decarboxylase subunit [uncultured delta proteobacterium]
MDILIQMFPGISTLFFQEPLIAFFRIGLIIFGLVLAYYGFKHTLEPLIMIPMGLGMIAINAGMLYLQDGSIGNIILAPLVSDPGELVNIMQVNFLQPIYSLSFANALIACLVFMGIGVMSEISFILVRPWTCMILALFGELGTFVTLIVGTYMGLPPGEAISVAIIGGADGPMVLFASLMLAPNLFVPIAIIAYLYLSLTYVGYPFLLRALVPAGYRGIDMEFEVPNVSKKTKFMMTVILCAILCLLLPVGAPLIVSFFLGVAIKEAEIEPLQKLLESTILYGSTFFMGLLLGVLCDASVLLNDKILILVILGIVALAVSGLGGIAGAWMFFKIFKGKFNPVLGVAAVSCMPTTAKIAQKVAMDENPYCIIMPIAMGTQICGVITTAIATGVFIATYKMLL